MRFEVRFTDRARTDFGTIPPEVRGRIARKLHQAARDPSRFFRKLAGVRAYRLRVGDYRVLADLDAKTRTIHVLHIGHRRNVYE